MAKTKPAKTTVDASWLLSDLDKPAFEPSETCYLTDAMGASLQNWANRGLLSPARTREGKGGTRLYTKTDVFTVKISQSLIRFGIDVSSALDLASTIVKTLFRAVAAIKDEKERIEVTLNATAWVYSDVPRRTLEITYTRAKIWAPDVDAMYVNIGGHLKQVLDAYNYGRED
jgi:hypothetical protein